MIRIASLESLSDFSVKLIEKSLCENVYLVDRGNIDNTDMSQTEILIARDRDVTEGLIKKCSNLKLLFIVSAGVEKLPFDILKKNEILVANSGDLSAEAMAEHVIGVMLMFSAKLLMSVINQKHKYWQKFVINDTLAGKRILIVGAGKIGRCIAKKANAFDMFTVGIKNSVTDIPCFDEICTLDNIDLQLSVADYVVCTLPLTELTENLFDYNKFSAMKRDSVFINISRGKLVIEDDLVRALNDKLIKGAAIDVFDPEPLNKNSLLWEFDNVIITPHSSGRIENFVEKTIPVFIKNVIEYKKSGKLVTKIDLDKKY